MRLGATAMALALVACATPASADVKMVAQMTGKMMGRNPSGETVTYIKGARMRTDQTMGSNKLSTIMDIESGELISINHRNKEAEIWNIADLATPMRAFEATIARCAATTSGRRSSSDRTGGTRHGMPCPAKTST